MKFRMLAFTAALVMLWVAAATAGASDQAGGEDSASQETVEIVTAERPDAVLSELKYEFDPVVDGTQIKHDFMVRNIGSGSLAIKQVKTG